MANKPRTYHRKARAAYLAIAKQKRPGRKTLRRGIKQQLQYLRRNLCRCPAGCCIVTR